MKKCYIYPRMTILCPKEMKEIDGNQCVKCKYYGYHDTTDEHFYIVCFYDPKIAVKIEED